MRSTRLALAVLTWSCASCKDAPPPPPPVVEEPAPVAAPVAPRDERAEPERTDAALRKGVESTCLDGRASDKWRTMCSCAADAFLRETRIEELRDIKSTGWNRDTLALLEIARRSCAEEK